MIMSTFSKSFASLGGFIAGAADVVDYIKHNARSLIFSASIPPSNTATALAALQVMREEPDRIQRVNQIGEKMRKAYHQLGFCNPGNPLRQLSRSLLGMTILHS